MRFIKQQIYQELPDDSDDEALIIHQRGSSSLCVFVHGLGGSRYGTWGSFPNFIFEDFPEADVGLYAYRTLAERTPSTSIDLEKEAQGFAGSLRVATEYERIVLIGHSMGGLLCQAAIAYLLKYRLDEVVGRLRGLILMATPQLGSHRVPRFLGSWFRDAEALRLHNELVTEVQGILQNHAEKAEWRTWAVLSSSDLWVDALSAGTGVPEPHKLRVRGSHTTIVKPAHKDAESYRFVRDAIAACLKTDSVAEVSSVERRDNATLPAGRLSADTEYEKHHVTTRTPDRTGVGQSTDPAAFLPQKNELALVVSHAATLLSQEFHERLGRHAETSQLQQDASAGADLTNALSSQDIARVAYYAAQLLHLNNSFVDPRSDAAGGER